MTDDELERRLTDLAAHLAWPATPDLAGAVTARLAQAADSGAGGTTPAPVDLAGRVRARIEAARPRAASGRPRLSGRRLVAVAAAVVLVAAAVVVALPGPREAVADLLGIGGVRITQGPSGTGPAP